MLTGIAFLSGAALFGVRLIHTSTSLRRLLTSAEQLLWGIITGWVIATLAAYFISSARGRLSYGPILVLTILLWTVSFALWFKSRNLPRLKEFRWKKIWRSEYLGIALVFTLFTPLYLLLFATHMFAPGAGGV